MGSVIAALVGRLARSSVAHVAFAFLAMGGWAVLANLTAGLGHALVAGGVQGAISGAITLGLKRFLETACERLAGGWAMIAPPLASCTVILAVLVGAHHLAGPRHIWATISIPYAISSSYAFIYTAMIVRLRGRPAGALTS